MSIAPKLTWFLDSPDAGDPACECSLCGNLITEEDGVPVRMVRQVDESDANYLGPDTVEEARFHSDCFNAWESA